MRWSVGGGCVEKAHPPLAVRVLRRVARMECTGVHRRCMGV